MEAQVIHIHTGHDVIKPCVEEASFLLYYLHLIPLHDDKSSHSLLRYGRVVALLLCIQLELVQKVPLSYQYHEVEFHSSINHNQVLDTTATLL